MISICSGDNDHTYGGPRNPTNCSRQYRIPQVVRQGIPDRWTSHTESPSAIVAELVTRYDQELLGGGSKMLP